MYRGASIAVVITAYDEDAFVGDVIRSVPAFVDRIYVVDDASPDACWPAIQQAAAAINGPAERPAEPPDDGDDRRVVPIRHPENRGYGAAVKTGYERAAADGIDVVAVMNGDGQMDPAILDRILDPVVTGAADYAKGNRLLAREDRTSMSTFRFVGNVLLSGLSKFATGYWAISDPQNGYTAISREAIETLDLDAITDRYGFLNHILTHLNVHECRVADVPMTAVYGDESSSIRYHTFVQFVSFLLLRSFYWRLKRRYVVDRFHPAVVFYGAGCAGLLAGSLGLLGAIKRAAGDGDGLTTSLASFSTLLTGTVSLGAAIALDAAENAALETRVDEPEPARSDEPGPMEEQYRPPAHVQALPTTSNEDSPVRSNADASPEPDAEERTVQADASGQAETDAEEKPAPTSLEQRL